MKIHTHVEIAEKDNVSPNVTFSISEIQGYQMMYFVEKAWESVKRWEKRHEEYIHPTNHPKANPLYPLLILATDPMLDTMGGFGTMLGKIKKYLIKIDKME